MDLAKSIILALCLALNLGIEEIRFSVKPTVYLMPEIVFVNQANYDMVKKTKVPRINMVFSTGGDQLVYILNIKHLPR